MGAYRDTQCSPYLLALAAVSLFISHGFHDLCDSIWRVDRRYLDIWAMCLPSPVLGSQCCVKECHVCQRLRVSHQSVATRHSCLRAHRISIAIIVSFVSRALSTIPGDLFCYNAISAAGIVLILPGFTIRGCFRLVSPYTSVTRLISVD